MNQLKWLDVDTIHGADKFGWNCPRCGDRFLTEPTAAGILASSDAATQHCQSCAELDLTNR